MTDGYKYKEITSSIISSAIEVHSILKNGFQETIYQRALEIEFAKRNFNYGREVTIPIFYKGAEIGSRRVDFLIENVVCLELKAVSALEDAHIAQALNYLEAFNLEIGLLLNFGSSSLEIKRLLNKKFDPLLSFNANNPTNKLSKQIS